MFRLAMWFQVRVFCQPLLLFYHPHVLSFSLIVSSSSLSPCPAEPVNSLLNKVSQFTVHFCQTFDQFSVPSSWLFQILWKTPFVLVLDFFLSLWFCLNICFLVLIWFDYLSDLYWISDFRLLLVFLTSLLLFVLAYLNLGFPGLWLVIPWFESGSFESNIDMLFRFSINLNRPVETT